jgi:glucose-1-phosphate thymidylyltransferase
VVSHYLMDKMRVAGARKAFVVLRRGKWDIPQYYGDGSRVGVRLCYLMQGLPYGVPFTLDQAHPFLGDSTVIMGYPDILFDPQDAFVRLLSRISNAASDVVLGLFSTCEPWKAHMVSVDEADRVRQIIIKPQESDLTQTWICAAWTPAFGDFMHEYLAGLVRDMRDLGAESPEAMGGEVTVSDVLQAAIGSGLCVEGLRFSDGSYLDIGTPENLRSVVGHSRTGSQVNAWLADRPTATGCHR